MTESSLIHLGHRGRMREKFLMHGSRVMQTYELLEMLLYHVVPYKDTNLIAKRLIKRFGDINGVLSASREQLMEIEGVGCGIADFLIKTAELINVGLSASGTRVFDDYATVGEFLVNKLSSFDTPRTAVMVFDNRMMLMGYDVICEHDYSSGAVKAEPFIDFALRHHAAVAITAHNHPHGPLFPTAGDMETNKMLADAFALAGVSMPEHYVVSGERYMGISRQLSVSILKNRSPELERFLRSREEKLNEQF